MERWRTPVMVVVWMVLCGVLWGVPSVYTAVSHCDHQFMGRLGSGILTSPNFPLNYSVRVHKCTYHIHSSDAILLQLPNNNSAQTNKDITPNAMYHAQQTPLVVRALGNSQRHQVSHNPTTTETAGNQEVVCFRFHRFSLGKYQENCTDTIKPYLEFPGHARYCSKGWLTRSITEGAPQSVFEDNFCWPIVYEYLTVTFVSTNNGRYTDTGFYATFNVTKKSPSTKNRPTSGHTLSKSRAPCADGYFMCFADQMCVPQNVLCNNVNDCLDGSDEDYSNARCIGEQNYSGCDFELNPSMRCESCHFTGFNWMRSNASKYGPRYDHTIGIRYGHGNFMFTVFSSMDRLPLSSKVQVRPPREPCARCFRFWYFMSGKDIGQLGLIINTTDMVVAENSSAWSRTDHQGSLWLPGEVDIPYYITAVTELSFLATKGESADANIAIDDLSLTDGACFGDDISCTFELGACGWYLDDQHNFTPWKLRKGSPASSTRPATDCSLDRQGWYMHTDFGAQHSNRTVRMVSRAVSNIATNQFWCLTYCYYKDGTGLLLNTSHLNIKLKHVDGYEQLVHSVDRSTDKYWDEQKLLLKDIYYPIQVIFEAVTSSSVEISIDSITMIPDPAACSSSPTPPPQTTVSPGPVTCVPRDFRCDDGECVSSERVCDGRFDCKDFSDEQNCGYAGLSVGAIGGIVSGLLLAIIICLSSFLWVRKHSQRTPQRHHPDPVPEDDFTNHSTYGEPPPVYTEIDATQYPLVACQHTLSFTVSWEPPPAYDLNPVLHNGPAVPSYTPHLDPPPFEENIDGLCTGHQRSSLLGEIGDGLSQSASTVPIRVGNRSGQQLQSISEQTPSNSSIYTQGRDITILLDPPPDDSSRRETYSDQSSTAIIRPPAIRPGHQTSVAIVGISATGEDLHRSFSTQQPVVYQVPNRYKSSHRGSSMAVIRPPVIRSGHQTSVAIVGRSATGEDLHRSFSTHQPVVYQVPNRYRRSCRGSFHRRPRRRARSRSNPRHSFHHQSANNSHDHLNQLQRTHHVSTDSTDV